MKYLKDKEDIQLHMAKQDSIKLDGEVVDVLPNATFKVLLVTGQTILGYISGKMRQNEIRIYDGDKVQMELSPYDLSKGRITRRM